MRTKRNGNTIQLFNKDDYIGSISLKELCRIIKEKKKQGTKENAAQIQNVTDDEYEAFMHQNR